MPWSWEQPVRWSVRSSETRRRISHAVHCRPTSDVSFEAAVRQNLDGVWIKGQYSEAIGAHWRATFAGAAIGGRERDFIGQYRRNSHVLLTVRYSF